MRRLWPLLSILFLAACSSSGPMHKPTPLQPLDAELLVTKQWAKQIPGNRLDEVYKRLVPVVANEVLYTVSAEGVVYALSTNGGKRLWKTDLDTIISAGLGYNDELLFVGTADAQVIALNRLDGEIRWQSRVTTEVLAPPAANGSYVIISCGDGEIYALNSENGLPLWQLKRNVPALSLRGNSTPVIVDDVVLMGTAEGHLLAVSIYNGDPLWETTIAVPKGRTDLERMVDVDATPLVIDGTIYSAAYQGRIVALSLDSGRVLWSRDIGSSAGLVADGANLYLVADDSYIWALDRRTGATLWRQDALAYRNLSTPALYDNYLVVGDVEGFLHWLSLEDGRIVARYQVDEGMAIGAPIQVKNNVAYVRNEHGEIEVLLSRNINDVIAESASKIVHQWWR